VDSTHDSTDGSGSAADPSPAIRVSGARNRLKTECPMAEYVEAKADEKPDYCSDRQGPTHGYMTLAHRRKTSTR
jgi:hypothetical protein